MIAFVYNLAEARKHVKEFQRLHKAYCFHLLLSKKIHFWWTFHPLVFKKKIPTPWEIDGLSRDAKFKPY
jgi:hypothetical protein